MTRRLHIVGWVLLLALAGHSLSAQVGSSDTDFLYARKLYDDKLYALAAQEFSRFVRNYPSDSRLPDARFYAGMAFFNTGEYDQARRDFQYLAVDFPKDKRAAEAWLKVAECHAALNDFAAAANALSSIAVFYPEAPNAVSSILLASEYHVRAGDLRSAKDKLVKLIADRPDIPEIPLIRLRLARLLSSEKNYGAAMDELQSVIDKSKNVDIVGEALLEKARLSEELGKSDDAKAALERILQRYDRSTSAAAAALELGHYALRERDFEVSRRRFESVLRMTDAPADSRDRARMGLGDIAFMLGQYVQAADEYKSLASGRWDRVIPLEANFKWGLALERSNLLHAASDRYLMIVDSAGERMADSVFVRLAYLKLADSYRSQKSYKQAAQYYDLFTKRYAGWPKMDRVYLHYGRLLQDHLHHHADAVHVYEALLREFPQSRLVDEAALSLIQAYEKSGQVQEAMDRLRRFRSDYPGSEWAQSAEEYGDFIATYHGNLENETMENLIVLLGGIIEGKPKDEIALAYARLYFEQLRDYRTAAQLFRKVVAITGNRKLEEEALFFQALSHDRLWRKGSEFAAYGDSAAVLYKRLLNGPNGDEVAMNLTDYYVRMESDPMERARRTRDDYGSMLAKYPESEHRDRMLLQLGKALLTLGDIGARDESRSGSLGKKSGKSDTTRGSQTPLNATDFFAEILERHSSSALLEEASFYHALCYAKMGVKDRRAATLGSYVARFPRGRHIARAKYMLAQLKEEQGDQAAASAIYQELIGKYYYSQYADSAAQGVGNTYLLTRQYQKAVDAYLANLARAEDEYAEIDVLTLQSDLHNTVEYRIAYAYEQLGNSTRAIEYYERYLFPDKKGDYAVEALKAVARLYEDRQLTEQAIRYHTALADLYPSSDAGAQALVRIGELRFQSESYDQAKRVYEKLSASANEATRKMIFDSRIIVCTYRLGQINLTASLEKTFNKTYQKDKALKVLLQDYNAEFMFELGRYYQYTGKNFDLAFRTYSRLIEDYPTAAIVPEALYEMGVIRYKQGKSKEGYGLLQQVLQKYPDSDILPRVYVRMAIEAFQLEQVQTAIEASKMAIQHPRISRTDAKYATDFLIKVYKAAGLYENALVLIQQYLERFPDDDPANRFSKRIDIGVMHKSLKAYDRAIDYFKDLIKTASGEDEAEIQYNIAETYFAKGNFEQALLEYLRIPYLTMGEKFDWSSAAKSQAAECYVRLRKYDEAIRLYEEIAKKAGPNSEYGLFSKQRIQEIRQLMKQ